MATADTPARIREAERFAREILPAVTKPITTYGLAADAQVRALDVRAEGECMRFRVARTGAAAALFQR